MVSLSWDCVVSFCRCSILRMAILRNRRSGRFIGRMEDCGMNEYTKASLSGALLAVVVIGAVMIGMVF